MNLSCRKKVGSFVAAMLFAMVFTGTALADETTFVPGTSVNGLGVGGLSVDQAKERIQGFYSSEYKLTIKEKGGKTETVTGEDIGFTVGLPDGFLENILAEQNANGRPSGPSVDNKHRVDMNNTHSAERLDARIESLDCISGADIVTTTDAHVSAYVEGEPFVIIPEVRGNNVDRDKTVQLIRDAVTTGASELDLVTSGCYFEPQVTKDDASLKTLCDTMNQCREMTITYVMGEHTELLEAPVICSWITGSADGQMQLDSQQVQAYVQSLADKYNTAGSTRTFHTATGRDVQVSGPYGWKINVSGEADALIGMIRTGQSQSREPLYSSAAVNHTLQEWGSTYVEVDLTGQHVYMVKDGAVVWDAPCVTGNVSKKYDTPAGIYSLTYKERDRVLRGAKRADGTYEYESPVSYWMPFNGGIGLHDANWRGSFGGTIYRNNGSHGCVNLPPNKVPALYELVYKGIPVICYH